MCNLCERRREKARKKGNSLRPPHRIYKFRSQIGPPLHILFDAISRVPSVSQIKVPFHTQSALPLFLGRWGRRDFQADQHTHTPTHTKGNEGRRSRTSTIDFVFVFEARSFFVGLASRQSFESVEQCYYFYRGREFHGGRSRATSRSIFRTSQGSFI